MKDSTKALRAVLDGLIGGTAVDLGVSMMPDWWFGAPNRMLYLEAVGAVASVPLAIASPRWRSVAIGVGAALGGRAISTVIRRHAG